MKTLIYAFTFGALFLCGCDKEEEKSNVPRLEISSNCQWRVTFNDNTEVAGIGNAELNIPQEATCAGIWPALTVESCPYPCNWTINASFDTAQAVWSGHYGVGEEHSIITRNNWHNGISVCW